MEYVQSQGPSMMRGEIVPETPQTPSISSGAESIATATPVTESEMEVDSSKLLSSCHSTKLMKSKLYLLHP